MAFSFIFVRAQYISFNETYPQQKETPMKTLARLIINFQNDRKAARMRRYEVELWEMIHGSRDFEIHPGR